MIKGKPRLRIRHTDVMNVKDTVFMLRTLTPFYYTHNHLLNVFFNDVEVLALIDTGSMRTFISNNIHDIIDFDRKLIDTTVAEHCVSITGVV